MHIVVRNVNEAFYKIVQGIDLVRNSRIISHSVQPIETITQDSRNGKVYRIPRPFTITYTHPWERVLFNKARDANPFFHLYEALWMLAGRNDLAPLQYYVSTFDQFSDDGETLNGAYGYRWRNGKRWVGYPGVPGETIYYPHKVDQIEEVMRHLSQNPNSRRAVLHMSNVQDDTSKMDSTKDQCCNLSVVFEIDNSEGEVVDTGAPKPEGGFYEEYVVYPKLNMTVFNRSNDLILGALGANAVHFSFLQEYVACCLGVEIGEYHQVSSNMHVYDWNFKPEEWLKDELIDYPGDRIPLVNDQATFDKEVQSFVASNYNPIIKELGSNRWEEPFLRQVAQPLLNAFHCHKDRSYSEAFDWLDLVNQRDWRVAGKNWITKRYGNWKKRETKEEV